MTPKEDQQPMTTREELVAHTPGPWRYSGFGLFVKQDCGDRIGPIIARCAGHDEDAESQANARLIAAAPELLRVAELLVDWLDEEPGAHKLCDTARAAIAKAAGEE
jgi:hypothetical protein